MKDNEIPRYHSRRGAERAIDDPDRIWEIIGKAKYVTLSMVTPEGEPYCVAISHGYDREKNCLYFHTGFEGIGPAGRKVLHDLIGLLPDVNDHSVILKCSVQ